MNKPHQIYTTIKKTRPELIALTWIVIPLGNILAPLILLFINHDCVDQKIRCIKFIANQIKTLSMLLILSPVALIPGGGIFIHIYIIAVYMILSCNAANKKSIGEKIILTSGIIYAAPIISMTFALIYSNNPYSKPIEITPPYEYTMDDGTKTRINTIEANGGKYTADIAFEFAELSAIVYYDRPPPGGIPWTHIKSYENKTSGFQAGVFRHYDKTIAIAFRGTEMEAGDIITDITMGLGIIPKQFKDAELIFKEIKGKYPESNIVLCGHSLGGSIAQYLSGKFNIQGYTFNAFGTADLTKTTMDKNSALLINYIENFDVVSGFNFKYTIAGAVISVIKSIRGEMPNQFGDIYIL